MSQFFDQASLVMVPSGYKTGKVYSQKPLSTDGELTFTRASSATRVGPDGLIQRVRTNLLTYSEDFSAARGWSVIGGSVTATANYGTAPDGTTTSTRIVFSSANEIWAKSITGLTGIGVFSLWIKGTAGQTILITYGGTSDKTITLGAGWNRFSTDGNSAISTQIFINTYGGATARDIEVWAGQVEFGDVMTDYIATTSAAVSVGPVANLPRLDYLGSSCPRLLLEPQTTALNTYSEQLDNAAWTKANLSVTANQTASPTGYSDADSLAEQAVNGIHYAGQGITSAAAGTYTFSCFLKQGTTQYGGFRAVVNGFTNRYFVLLDLSNGSVVNTNTTASGVTWTHKVDNYENGWYRLSVTAAHTSGNIDISISTSDTATPTYFGGLPTYLGTNKFIYAWGANITATSYLQSYVPTLGAAVTRTADACSKTGISSLIGQTEGTLFLDVAAIASESTNKRISISDGTNNNRIALSFANASITAFVVSGGIASVANSLGISTPEEKHKIAVAYKENDFVVYVDGVQVFVSTSGNVPVSLTEFKFSDGTGAPFFGNLDQALLFKTRLTNAKLAELTTL